MLANLPLDYIGGRENFPLTVWLFPAGLIPFFLAACCILTLFVRTVVSIFKRKEFVYKFILCVIALAAFVIILNSFPSSKIFLFGFRTYVLSRVTPDQIEDIASSFDKYVSPDKKLSGPKNYSTDELDNKSKWAHVSENSAIGQLNDSCVLYKTDDDGIIVEWGGTLIGHWGLRITKGNIQRLPQEFAYLQLNDRIAAYYSD